MSKTVTEAIENLAKKLGATEQEIQDSKTKANAIDLLNKYANGSAELITCNDLKKLKDNGELIPGKSYRITDYQAVTLQSDSRAMNNQFDIIVTAIDKNTLSEDARACLHEGDEYFKNCNLSAWELKYRLEARKRLYKVVGTLEDNYSLVFIRYPEADTENKCAWAYCEAGYRTIEDLEKIDIDFLIKRNEIWYDDLAFTDTEEIIPGVTTLDYYGDLYDKLDYVEVLHNEEPEGVYYMKDEFNNECPYDFKNIQFKRYYIDNKYDYGYEEDEEDTPFIWAYTFTEFDTWNDTSLLKENDVHDNIIKGWNNVFFGHKIYFNKLFEGRKYITTYEGFTENTLYCCDTEYCTSFFHRNFKRNILDKNSTGIFGMNCSENYIGISSFALFW